MCETDSLQVSQEGQLCMGNHTGPLRPGRQGQRDEHSHLYQGQKGSLPSRILVARERPRQGEGLQKEPQSSIFSRSHRHRTHPPMLTVLFLAFLAGPMLHLP